MEGKMKNGAAAPAIKKFMHPQEVELKAGDGIKDLVFFNDRLPGIHLIKVDSSDLSQPIANARFRFEAVDGSFGPVEYTTLEDGTIDLSKLPADTAYIVTELECPGYIVDDAQRTIHLDGGEQAQFVFTNSKLPSLHLYKESADGTPLGGVTYRLAKIEDGSRYLDRTTSKHIRQLICQFSGLLDRNLNQVVILSQFEIGTMILRRYCDVWIFFQFRHNICQFP